MKRKCSQDEATVELAWLSDVFEDQGLVTGLDADSWEDSIWILHSMYELDESVEVVSHQDLRLLMLEQGLAERQMIGDVDLDKETITTGVPLGSSAHPGPGWHRLRWSELAERLTRPFPPPSDYPPSHSWFPYRSWPARIQPPCEGSIDRSSMVALVEVLQDNTPVGLEQVGCVAFFGSLATGDFDNLTMFEGSLEDMREISIGTEHEQFTPSNIWPRTRDWFVYTDYDLLATRVSGTRNLISKLESRPELETTRWSANG